MSLRHWVRWSALPALCFACPLPWQAIAQDYPSRALKIIAPYPAGGSVDLPGCAFTESMQAALGRPIVVEKRTGASGVILHQAIARVGRWLHQRLFWHFAAGARAPTPWSIW